MGVGLYTIILDTVSLSHCGPWKYCDGGVPPLVPLLGRRYRDQITQRFVAGGGVGGETWQPPPPIPLARAIVYVELNFSRFI